MTDFSASFEPEGVARVVTDGTEIAVEGLAPGETTLTLTLVYADGSTQTLTRRITVA